MDSASDAEHDASEALAISSSSSATKGAAIDRRRSPASRHGGKKDDLRQIVVDYEEPGKFVLRDI